jgi:predicted transposase YdaD
MLIARRRDIMIESAAYDIIKQEGIQEGIQRGKIQGIQEGKSLGIQEGKATGIRESLAILIESKFGKESAQILKRLDSISDTDRLLGMFRVIHHARNAEELLDRINSENQ